MLKKHGFALFISIFTAVAFISLRILSKNSVLISQQNQVIFANFLLSVFIFFTLCLFVFEFFVQPQKTNYKIPDILLIFSICCLLLLSIFNKQIGIYATALFIFSTLIYLISNRKVYALNPIYLLVFSYPILEFIGTIGTPGGFRFPEMTLTFYLVPFAFCCFKLDKELIIKILRFVFRAILIFMMLSLIHWYFNILHIKVGVVEWISTKVLVNGVAAFEFVCSWSMYKHPSYINLVILPALMSGFYIYHKQQASAFISKLELILFVVFCVFLQLVLESRIGLIGVFFILVFTGLYYLHLKKIYFKIALVSLFVLGATGMFVMQNSVSNFISDPIRKTDTALAIHYIKSHIWWGAGYYQEAAVLRQVQAELKGIVPENNFPKTYTHNQLLGTMIQFGIPGAAILLFLMSGLLWYAFHSRNYLMQLLICMYILFMMIEEPLYVQEGITRFMVFLSIFVHLGESEKSKKNYTLFNRLPKS